MMLKSMGIWKSTSEPNGQVAAIMSTTEGGEYRLVDGQLVAVGANGSSIAAPTSSATSAHNSTRYIKYYFCKYFLFKFHVNF